MSLTSNSKRAIFDFRASVNAYEFESVPYIKHHMTSEDLECTSLKMFLYFFVRFFLFFVLYGKILAQVWTIMRVSKWWHRVKFWYFYFYLSLLLSIGTGLTDSLVWAEMEPCDWLLLKEAASRGERGGVTRLGLLQSEWDRDPETHNLYNYLHIHHSCNSTGSMM